MFQRLVFSRFYGIFRSSRLHGFHRNIVTSHIPDIELFPGSLTDRVFKDVDKYPDKIAIVDGISGTQYSFSQMFQLIKNVSSGLAKVKVGKGKTVGIILHNSPEYIFSIYGILATGAKVTFFNQALKTDEMATLIKISHVDVLITSSDLLPNVQEAAKQAGSVKDIYVVGDSPSGTKSFYQELLEDNGRESPFGQITIDPMNDVAFIPFSSGTTGLPKGVMLTHNNLTIDIEQLNALKKTPPEGDITLISLPLFHMFGLAILNFSLAYGCRVVTLPKFEPLTYLEALSKQKVSYLYAVPPQLLFLTNYPGVSDYDLSNLQQVLSAAAPLGQTVQEAFYKRMKTISPGIDVFQGYGMTELSPVSHIVPPREKRPPTKEMTNSVGVLAPNMQMKIVSEDGEELGPNEVGELVLKGPNVMKEYIDNPEATNNCIKDGWLYTGDVGKYDEDNYLFIVDRVKELIKYKGLQVAPAELEALLHSHPAVGHAAVIGKPDDRAGEVPLAFVVKKGEVTEKELQDFVAERCSDYKQLRGGVNFVKEIPLAPSGKILRKELRKLFKQ